MTESAFKGTVLEGRERKYTVLNEKDIKKYGTQEHVKAFEYALDALLLDVETGRERDGKNPYNSYIVINTDEPYIDEIIAVMKKYVHFKEAEK